MSKPEYPAWIGSRHRHQDRVASEPWGCNNLRRFVIRTSQSSEPQPQRGTRQARAQGTPVKAQRKRWTHPPSTGPRWGFLFGCPSVSNQKNQKKANRPFWGSSSLVGKPLAQKRLNEKTQQRTPENPKKTPQKKPKKTPQKTLLTH